VREGVKFEKFPACGTSTGWFINCFCCSRVCCSRQSDIEQELGVGVSIYFKQLKNMIVMLYLFTLLSLPAYALFWSGKTLNNPIKQAEKSMSFPNFVATISLANVGDATKNDE